MWGRFLAPSEASYIPRNTPTHVGKIIDGSAAGTIVKKHPHACGEDEPWQATIAGTRETPPRMWGRFHHALILAHDNGNTPTHVGKITPN